MRRRLWDVGIGIAIVLAAAPAYAVVLGGGVADKDCRLGYVGVDATDGASGVVCVDGDSGCDTGGLTDGVCRFAVTMCVGVPVEGCAPVEMDHLNVSGVPLAPPALPATSGCGETTIVHVVAGGPAAGTTVRGYRAGELGEVDYLNLCCISTAGPLDAAACSVAVDAAASGCAELPERAERTLERARGLIDAALSDEAHAAKLLRKAGKRVKRLRVLGQKVARRDDCGFALALMASHAEATLEAARIAAAIDAPEGR